MAIVNNSQPTVRFNMAGPYGLQGVSYEPKIMFIKKTVTTTEGYDDFWVAPSGTFITHAFGLVTGGSGNTTTQVSLGQDGSAHSIIAYTDLSAQTAGNATYFQTGIYLNAGDTLRITVGGTAAAAEVYYILEYFETGAMTPHFSL